MYNVILQTAREGGATALWRGLTPTLLGVVPYAGTSFFTYETLKQYYQTVYSCAPPPLPRLAFGAFAGMWNTLCSSYNTVYMYIVAALPGMKSVIQECVN